MASNKYGLPKKAVEKILERDKTCVYCHKKVIYPHSTGTQRDWATIEHLNHLPPWDNPSTIVICCGSCNSSRGNKKLIDWFKTSYCTSRNININTVAEPVREYLHNQKTTKTNSLVFLMK